MLVAFLLFLVTVNAADDAAVVAAARQWNAFRGDYKDSDESRFDCLVRWRGFPPPDALYFSPIDGGPSIQIPEELIKALVARNKSCRRRVSLPGYSKDRRKAVVAFMRGGEGYTAYLERDRYGWRLSAIGGRWLEL